MWTACSETVGATGAPLPVCGSRARLPPVAALAAAAAAAAAADGPVGLGLVEIAAFVVRRVLGVGGLVLDGLLVVGSGSGSGSADRLRLGGGGSGSSATGAASVASSAPASCAGSRS